MKRGAFLVVLLVASGLASWLIHRPTGGTRAQAAVEPATPAAPASASPPGAAPTREVPTRATRITAEERRAIADRIAAAHARPGYHAPTPRPALPAGAAGDEPAPAISKQDLRTAMRGVIPELTACYEAALPALADPDLEISAHMMLTGDRDIGTLIDADQLFDGTGKPLPAPLDSCLRATFQSLELPPLAEGDQIEVRYPFSFRPN